MTEETNIPGQESKLAQAVGETIPEPVVSKDFNYLDEHTAENTPMKNFPPAQSQTKSELQEVNRENGFSTIFLGTSKQDFDKVNELLGRWLSLEGIRQSRRKGMASESMFNSAENEWASYVEKEYPGISAITIEERSKELYRFFDNTRDSILSRSRVPLEDSTNVSRYSTKLTAADIVARTPNGSTEGFSVSELMARSAAHVTGTAHRYSVLLRNSFTTLDFARVNKHDLGDVVNDINSTVRGYVRQVGNNTLTIASIAGMKAVWEWFHPYILSSSIKDLLDFKDLINVINIKDFPTLCNAILASITDDGVGMDLRCIEVSCDHGSFELIDPTKLTNIRPGIQTEEEAAILGNLANGRVTYTMEQVLALIEQSTYGLETKYVYNDSRRLRLTIDPPSMADAFVTFDYFVGQIDPRLAKVRSKIVNEQQLQEQLAIELNRLGASEYIHFVSEYTILGPEGSDTPPRVLRRADCNPDEFNKGLMSALERDASLNTAVTRFIYLKSPYMTRTFTGIRNRVCPKCGHGNHEGTGVALGYTPIDSFMTFFTHTQMTIMAEAVKRQAVVKEALSQ